MFLYQLTGDVFVAGLFGSDLPLQDCFVHLENIVWVLTYFCGGDVRSDKV